MYPDQSLYPANSVPAVVKRINQTLQRADQIARAEGKNDIDWFVPIVADAEAGFGGPLNVFELIKAMIEAGAAGVHLEDQLASEKKCGHMGGKVLVPTRVAIAHLIAARLAADVCDVPTLVLARTDANAAALLTSDADERDREFLTGERTVEGFFRVRSGLDQAIAGGVRGRKARIQCDQTSTRSRHRLLRRCRSGYLRWPVLHHGVARFNRTRTVSLNRAETASSAAAALTDSRLAALCAEEARNAFRDYVARFDEITQRARDRFLARDWHGSYNDATERLHLYSRVLDGLTNRVESLLGARLRERSVWQATKAVYSSLIAQSIRWEIGESFFNSLTRRVFATEGVDQAIEFIDTDFDAPPTEHDAELCRASTGAALPDLISSALTDANSGFANHHWRDLDGAIAAAAERILSRIVQQKDATLEIFRGVFYRGCGAYLVGRIHAGADAIPVALFVLHQ